MTVKSRAQGWFSMSASEADFEQFYRTELPRVYNFFRFRVGDDQIAEDLTSETMEKAWRHREKYRSDLASFSTWLFTVARRVAIDHYRRRRPQVPIDDNLSSATNIEDTIERIGDLERLAGLVSKLSQRDQDLFSLKYGAGLSNVRIARIMGLSESNTGVILHRALQTLRTEWERLL